MRAASSSHVSSTTFPVSMKDLVGNLPHRHPPHPIALLQHVEAIQNVTQKRQVLLQVDAEIVRVPPQMKQFSMPGRRFHRRVDAPQAQPFQHSALSHRPQKTARRDVDHAVDDGRLMLMGSADRQITVEQARRTDEMRLFCLAAGSMEPSALVSPKSPQAEFATDWQMRRSNLVAWKGDACERNAERVGGGSRSLEIRAKSRDVASLFQAIKMRKGMRPDLLALAIQDLPDQ